MKILIAADGSSYTKRMLAYLGAHPELLGPKHDYTVVHSVLAVPHRAAAGTDPVSRSVVRPWWHPAPARLPALLHGCCARYGRARSR